MRLRISDRILVGLAGLLLIACCAGIAAQLFFGVDLVGIAGQVFSSESVKVRAALIAFSLFLLILGIYCFFVLFRHRRKKDKFILQKNESGELAISLKALENMVNKCLVQHKEIHVQNLHMENQKDGLLIRLRGSVAGGISIPLTVEALQRQIKQYVTACSGVEVKGIRIQIDSSDRDAVNAPFAIEGPSVKPLLKDNNGKTPESSELPAPTVSDTAETAPQALEGPPAENVVPIEEDDDRPLHQRLFKPKYEPCIVPAPPESAPEAEVKEEGSDQPEAEQPPEEAAETVCESESGQIETGTETDTETPVREDTQEEETPSEEPVCEAQEEMPGADTAAKESPDNADISEEEPETEEKRAAREAFAESQKAFDQLITGK